MVQGKIKSGKSNKKDYFSKKRQIRHEKLNRTAGHHFSQPKEVKIPQKKRESTNDPGVLSKIYEKQIDKNIKKKIISHQKKVYKSIEQTIIEKAKKNNEIFDIL